MFAVSDEDVKKILNLARLSEDPGQPLIEKIKEQLNQFLEYAKDVQKVDVSSVDPFKGIRTVSLDELREDEIDVDQEKYARVRSNIINNFPKTQNNLLVIKGIFDN